MKRVFILASHGSFASGIKSSLDLIIGPQALIYTLDAYVEEQDIAQAAAALLARFIDHEIVVITDIYGGSVNNEFQKYIDRDHYHLVAGLNLPFLIELLIHEGQAADIAQCIREALQRSKEMIQYCNDSFVKQEGEEDF